MSPSERKFKKEYSKELLKIAKNDFLAAIDLSKNPQIRPETALFLMEQAVEKSLKAVICHLGMSVPLTHDLYAIVQRLGPANLPPGGYALHDLTPYASIRRYEEGAAIISEQEVTDAVSAVSAVLAWAEGRIGQ